VKTLIYTTVIREISITLSLALKILLTIQNISHIANKNTKEFKLVKGAASADDEISAISGSTITSTAVTNAVNAALYFGISRKGVPVNPAGWIK